MHTNPIARLQRSENVPVPTTQAVGLGFYISRPWRLQATVNDFVQS